MSYYKTDNYRHHAERQQVYLHPAGLPDRVEERSCYVTSGNWMRNFVRTSDYEVNIIRMNYRDNSKMKREKHDLLRLARFLKLSKLRRKPERIQNHIENDFSELHMLVMMVNTGYKCSLYNFEANYENSDFPNGNVKAKLLLQRIIKSHILHRRSILQEPKLLETVTYQYTCNGKQYVFDFHNNMELHDDMLTVLYLHTAITPIAFRTEPVQKLIKILHNKYNISYSFYANNTNITNSKTTQLIPIYYLLFLFPSIAVSLFENNLNYLARQSEILFAQICFAPRAIYYNMIDMLIPHTVAGPPLALLVFIKMKYLSVIFNPDEQSISLQRIYTFTKKIFNNNFIPEELKIRLCKSWGIVECNKKEQNLRFNPRIVIANKRAKNILRFHYMNEPNADEIFVQI